MTLPWLPHGFYVSVTDPLEVWQNLPPSHCQVPKSIVLLPPEAPDVVVLDLTV